MKSYKEKYNVFAVQFLDECISPKMAVMLAERINKDGIKILFGSMARFEEKFIDLIPELSKAGLKFLLFGMESGSQRIINLMNKGYKIEVIQNILDACKKHAVFVGIDIMFGFPTETESEAQETIDFLIKNSEKFVSLRIDCFVLMPNTEVYKNPNKFDISYIDPNYDPSDDSTYKRESGINNITAREFIKKAAESPQLKEKALMNEDNFTEEAIFYKTALELAKSAIHHDEMV